MGLSVTVFKVSLLSVRQAWGDFSPTSGVC